jgi:hypothetical protein
VSLSELMIQSLMINGHALQSRLTHTSQAMETSRAAAPAIGGSLRSLGKFNRNVATHHRISDCDHNNVVTHHRTSSCVQRS